MNFASPRATVVKQALELGLVLLVAAGCSGRPKNVARSVTGRVTLGGQPLPGAMVGFAPVEGGSPAMGRTDQNGSYRLVWGRSGRRIIEGAEIGESTVMISTHVPEAPSAKPPKPEVPEKVPYKYRAEVPLKATVKSGANVFNFDLEPGPVDPPQPKGKGKKK